MATGSPKTKKWQVPLIVVLALIAGTSTVIAAKLNADLSQLKQHPELQADQEAANIVAKVSVLIDLPADETPSIATVSDPESLKDQPFFAKAQVGDKVLIYANAKKAILYNPTLNKVMDVTQLTMDDQATPSDSVFPTDTPDDSSDLSDTHQDDSTITE